MKLVSTYYIIPFSQLKTGGFCFFVFYKYNAYQLNNCKTKSKENRRVVYTLQKAYKNIYIIYDMHVCIQIFFLFNKKVKISCLLHTESHLPHFYMKALTKSLRKVLLQCLYFIKKKNYFKSHITLIHTKHIQNKSFRSNPSGTGRDTFRQMRLL